MLKTALTELLPQFDAILVDQFGVLIDANGPYPEAIETLKKISLLEKSVYILSNSGKRAAQNKDRLTRLGFDPKSFDGVITSGELAYCSLKKIRMLFLPIYWYITFLGTMTLRFSRVLATM